MKLYLVRHGEPSYTPCTRRGLIGQGRDLAALNDIGIAEMIEAGKRLSETDAEVILSSPYTRALQSSAIVAKETGLTTVVVHDLHEWIPDTTFQYGSYKELKLLLSNIKGYCRKKCPSMLNIRDGNP
jgi:broad specificity phosphatase PhoE